MCFTSFYQDCLEISIGLFYTVPVLVLMRNHVHLVLEPTPHGGKLSEIMKGINLSYAQYFKSKYNRVGHFWQDRFKSIIIARDEYLLACGSYVELNPVRAKIATDPKDYLWSSYHVHAFGKKDVLVDEHPIYQTLSADEAQRQARYREFVKGRIDKKKAMKGEMNKKAIYGSAEFIKALQSEYSLEAHIKPKGRPKK